MSSRLTLELNHVLHTLRITSQKQLSTETRFVSSFGPSSTIKQSKGMSNELYHKIKKEHLIIHHDGLSSYKLTDKAIEAQKNHVNNLLKQGFDLEDLKRLSRNLLQRKIKEFRAKCTYDTFEDYFAIRNLYKVINKFY